MYDGDVGFGLFGVEVRVVGDDDNADVVVLSAVCCLGVVFLRWRRWC